MDWLSAALEEYKTLRTESLGSIEAAQRSLQLGLAGIAAITAFGSAHAGSSEVIENFVLGIAAPLLAGPVVVLWLLEIRRAISAGAHVAYLENRIRKEVSPENAPMTWEGANFSGNRPTTYDWAVFATLFLFTLPSVILGFYGLGKEGEALSIVLAAVVDLLVITSAVAFLRGKHSEIRRIEEQTRTKIANDVPGGPAPSH